MATFSGTFTVCSRVVNFSSVHSLESTGFIKYAFILSISSLLKFPFNTYILAVLAIGLVPDVMICKHSDNEFALWSNCPGKYSIPNTVSFFSNGYSSSKQISTCGSEKIVVLAFL